MTASYCCVLRILLRSGEFYVVIDAEKCDGCAKCVAVCPQQAFKMETQLIDLEDKTVAAVTEEHRKKSNTRARHVSLKAKAPSMRLSRLQINFEREKMGDLLIEIIEVLRNNDFFKLLI